MASIFGVSDEAYKKSGTSLSDIVERWANLAITELHLSLEKKVKLATSRKLYQSIVPLPTKFDGNKITVEIKGEKYWKFINDGVQGVGGETKKGYKWTNKALSSPFSFKKDKKPSARHFEDWARLAGRSPFAVAETVYRSGIKPNHFFDEVINDDFTDTLAADLKKSLSRVIEVDLKLGFDGISN